MTQHRIYTMPEQENIEGHHYHGDHSFADFDCPVCNALDRLEEAADEAKQLRQDKAELLAAAEKVGPAIQTLLDEAAGKEATDWGLVNECLLLAQAAIAKHGKEV